VTRIHREKSHDTNARYSGALLASGILVSALLAACTGSLGEDPDGDGTPGSGASGSGGPGVDGGDEGPPPPFEPAPPVMVRLTQAQYKNAIFDLLGVTEEYALASDTRPYLFSVIGNASDAVSELGVVQYGAAAYDIGSVFADATKRTAIASCSAAAPLTEDCLSTFIRDFGLRVFRRPLTEAEQARYHALGVSIGLADPGMALQYVTAALLQSPNFLYRVDVGEADAEHPEWLRYGAYEMATRLSFLLRNTIPDAELLAAAASGELNTLDGVIAQTTRLFGDTNATKLAVDQLFSEYLDLPLLFDTSSVQFPVEIDPNGTLATSMQTEVLSLINRVAIDESSDMRLLLSTRNTSVNAELANLYGVTAPAGGAFQAVELPADGARAGLLTTAGILSLNNRPYRTAPTLRGRFVFQRMLCGTIDPPPANIPPLEEMAVAPGATLREVLQAHAENPVCNGCHSAMDPIGLGMEDFDRYGRYRTVDDHGNPVDAASELDDQSFTGARELGELLAQDSRLPSCFVKQFFRYANARLETPNERIVLEGIEDEFAASGYGFQPLMVALVSSDGFRYLKSEAP
jgi:hypothetical protein